MDLSQHVAMMTQVFLFKQLTFNLSDKFVAVDKTFSP